MEQVKQFIEELRLNWDNAYWWADHATLQAIVLGVVTGVVGLLFVYLECRVKRSMLNGLGGAQ